MHILFLSDNFPPESNAPANRTFEHARRWVEAGHQVTVITCFPNFPTGKIFPGYRQRLYSRELMEGIEVVRVISYMTANEGFLRRTLDYVSFMLSSSMVSVFIRKVDVVIATSPQFFCALGGLWAATIKRRPFVLEIRDLWPDSIVAVGAMKDRSRTIGMLERLERLLYRRADAIVVVTDAFRRIISERVDDASKITVVVNGVEAEQFTPREPDLALRDELGFGDRFVVGYIGTHGMAHDLDNVLDAVEALRHRKDIAFLFVGHGAARSALEQRVSISGLDNVKLLGQQPRERVPELCAQCDVALIPLRNDPVFSTVIPSKLFECMAMALPVLMALPEGEATAIVREHGCGVVVPPGDALSLAKAIEGMEADPEGLVAMQYAARQAATHYSRRAMAERMLGVIEGQQC